MNPVLHSRANFSSSLNEFLIFHKITLEDLKCKQRILKAQKKLPGLSKKANNYISCQICMLKKHIQSLTSFSDATETRINVFLQNVETRSNNESNDTFDKCETFKKDRSNGDRRFLNDKLFHNSEPNCSSFEDKIAQHSNIASSTFLCHNSEADARSTGFPVDKYLDQETSDTTTKMSSLNDNVMQNTQADVLTNIIHDKNNDLTNCYSTNIALSDIRSNKVNCADFMNMAVDCSLDQQLLKLLADIKKMKTLCKKMLDITDKHCVVNNDMDLNLSLQENEVADFNITVSNSPTTSVWATQYSSSTTINEKDGSRNNSIHMSNLELPVSLNERGWVKMTLHSLRDHISLLVKVNTYKHLYY